MFPILNRAVGLEGLTKAEIEQQLGIPIKTSVPYLGGNFSMANNQHQPFSVKFPRDTAAIVMKETAQQMVDVAKRVRAGWARRLKAAPQHSRSKDGTVEPAGRS
jgi:hypothetical protein